MGTKVLDFEVTQLPERVSGLDGYARALCLFRHRQIPIAEARVQVKNGRITGAALRETLLARFGRELCMAWLDTLLENGPEPPPAFQGKITIAVCTRDRPDDLRNCLKSLDRLPNDGQEVIVIDNASQLPSTKEIVLEYGRARYIREDRPGLNCARNRAVKEARGEVIAFIDDDATADPIWLRGLASGFDSPVTAAVGGLTMPSELETEAQELFEVLGGFGRGFRKRRFNLETHSPLSGGTAGSGVNMALRREVLDKIGNFDEALDAGTVTLSGGDTEMFSRILAAGYEIVYEPKALNWHRHRRSREELRHTFYGYGVGLYAAWTRCLIYGREWGVLKAAYRWFIGIQLPRLIQALKGRPGGWPWDLAWAEFCGSLRGPWAYFHARRKVRSNPEPS